jgi:hypothetical protein
MNWFPPIISLKQLQDILEEEVLLKTVQNLYESFPRRIAAVLKEKAGQTPC